MVSNPVLADFLRTRRARLHPVDIGMPEGPARRVPGLRREEVAELAGISTSWYTLLEQGQRTDISAGALRAIARALKLNSHETVYLYTVARETIPTDCLIQLGNDTGHAQALESIARTDYLLCYEDAGTLVDVTGGVARMARLRSRSAARGEHLYRRVFTNLDIRAHTLNWETVADHAAAVLRFHCAAADTPPPFMPELLALPEFIERWSRHDVHSDVGWRPDYSARVAGIDVPIAARSFGFMAPGGGRVIYYFGITAADEERMRVVSRLARDDQ
jgi:transcriptional regulator with XRE-family HTH domain